MSKSTNVTKEEAEAVMPEWIKNNTALRKLFHSYLGKRMEKSRAKSDESAQNILRYFARDWNNPINTITIAEAERRWNKKNLRQLISVYKWKSGGTWLTTTFIMESIYGPEPDSG